MKIVYGGLELKIMKTNQISRDHILSADGLTYLYTRYAINVIAVVNPKATSQPEGSLPATSDKALLQILRAPRLPLKVTREIEDQIFIDFDDVCDVKGGPFPRLYNIEQVNGVKTYIVRWAVEYFATECDDTPTILSNRWSATEDVDENHFPIRVFRGRAVFNLTKIYGGSNLKAGGGPAIATTPLTPDQYRVYLFPETPNGWRRTRIDVQQGSDAATVDYTVVDHWAPIRWGKFAACKVDAWHSSVLSQESRGEEWINFAVYHGPKAIYEGATEGGKKYGPVGAFVGGGAALAGAALTSAKRILPQNFEVVHVEVQGDGDTTIANLLALATDIAFGKIAYYINLMNFMPNVQFRVDRDLVHKWVSVDFSIQRGTWDKVFNKLLTWAMDSTDQTEILTSPAGRVLLTPSPGDAPLYPPADGGHRGTPEAKDQLLSLVTQILELPCKTVGKPANVTVAQNPTQPLN